MINRQSEKWALMIDESTCNSYGEEILTSKKIADIDVAIHVKTNIQGLNNGVNRLISDYVGITTYSPITKGMYLQKGDRILTIDYFIDGRRTQLFLNESSGVK